MNNLKTNFINLRFEGIRYYSINVNRKIILLEVRIGNYSFKKDKNLLRIKKHIIIIKYHFN